VKQILGIIVKSSPDDKLLKLFLQLFRKIVKLFGSTTIVNRKIRTDYSSRTSSHDDNIVDCGRPICRSTKDETTDD
jgi:hypothetical protein